MNPVAVKVSYSGAGKLPAYGAKTPKLAGTTSLAAQPQAIARALAAQRSTPNPVSDVLSSNQVSSANRPGGGSTLTPLPAFTPAPAGTAPAGSNTPATTGGGSTFTDYNDPIVAQIQAAGQRSTLDAQSARDAAYKQSLVRFGDPTLATTLTGGDAATGAAAGQNPTSTLAQLLFQHTQNQQAIDEAKNAQNLFYSSARANQLGDEQQNYLFNQSGAQDQLQQQLGSYDTALQQARAAAQDQLLGALPGAFDRWSSLAPPPVAAGGTGGDGGGPVDQASSGGYVPNLTQNAPSLAAMLAALATGPGASQSRLGRFAG